MAQPSVRQHNVTRSRIARPGGIPASRSGDRIHLTEAASSSHLAKAKGPKQIGVVAAAAGGKLRADSSKAMPQRAALSDVSNRVGAVRGNANVDGAVKLAPGQQGLRVQHTKSMTRLRDARSRSTTEERLPGPTRSLSEQHDLASGGVQSMEVEAPRLLPPFQSSASIKAGIQNGASSSKLQEDAEIEDLAAAHDDDVDEDDMSDVHSTTDSDDDTGEDVDVDHGSWLESERLDAGARPESVTSAEDGDLLDFNIDPEGLVSLHPELEEAARRKVALIKSRYQEEVIAPRAARAQLQRAEQVALGQLTADLAAHEDELIAMGLDPEEVRDTSMVAEYATEIFGYMARCERETMANPNYMEFQSEIHWHMRATLVDWLLQVHMRYHMLPETLWIAINIVDRFLSVRVVSLAKLQLVGVTAMFIAAKYEEILAPSVKEFVYMTEGGYSQEEILKGERIILSTLDFNVSSYCSPYSWVRKISKADDYDIRTRTLSKFLMELALLDHRFLRARPSLIAAVGMFLAKKMLGGEWDDAFVYYSDFTEEQLVPGANLLLERLLDPGFEEQFVYRKYANKKFLKASVFARDWAYQNHSALLAAAAAAAAAAQSQ
ncbi:Cyclin, N-terminal [Kalmanozyma brasiliensis GHG001]|uniref:B-type cyclin n=1 Tax=Kalmanozyma brasiliensis (strain GHG001) TaxID=1365824 RepID=V5ERP7_KALBG|nr:Cyclin, N-terminal [Kalmanozyma brasiliensis GHG001]EST05598.1 Cyclin, N-terminal [Kalmanozyma brasiliensis GHG001]